MASFIQSGVTEDDYWLVDGSRDFSLLPANTITGWDIDLPIRLHVGNVAYGQIHMQKHLPKFRDRQKRTIPELIYYKLGQSGNIYNTEKELKHKIKFGLAPDAVVLMERRYVNLPKGQRDEYLSLVTFYPSPGRLDGVPIARYDSHNQRLCIAAAIKEAAAVISSAAEADIIPKRQSVNEA